MMNNWIEKFSALVVIVVVVSVLIGLLRLVLDNIWYVLAVIGAAAAAWYLYSQTER
jgi:uncharacterized membrane protein required for colicin V production